MPTGTLQQRTDIRDELAEQGIKLLEYKRWREVEHVTSVVDVNLINGIALRF